MAAPFDPALHPHGWHGEFSPTGGHRNLGRSLQSVNQNHPPGGFGTVLSMAYGGVIGNPGNVSATISYSAAPTLPANIVHVAGWAGVSSGENHWLQAGIAFLPSGQARLYVESRNARGQYSFVDLGAAVAHTGYKVAVTKAGNVWVATVNGRRVAVVKLPPVDSSAVSAEVASSTYQPTGATYQLHFRDVKAPGAGKPAGKPGAQVQAVRGGFDVVSAPKVAKGDTPVVEYPVLVRKAVERVRYPDLLKEQPSVSDVHVDTPSDVVSVAPVKGKKRKPKVEDVGDPELAVKVVKADKAKQLVYGIVLEPHRIDSQGDWEAPDDIEKACHHYLGLVFKEGVTDLTNLQHRWDAEGVYPVENYIAPADFTLNGEPVHKGSWVLVMKVENPQVWDEVEKGEWGGFSVEGTGRRNYGQPVPVV